jgi:hypothetical protein
MRDEAFFLRRLLSPDYSPSFEYSGQSVGVNVGMRVRL